MPLSCSTLPTTNTQVSLHSERKQGSVPISTKASGRFPHSWVETQGSQMPMFLDIQPSQMRLHRHIRRLGLMAHFTHTLAVRSCFDIADVLREVVLPYSQTQSDYLDCAILKWNLALLLKVIATPAAGIPYTTPHKFTLGDAVEI